MENEMKKSTIDFRTLYSKNISKDFIDKLA